MHVEQVVTEGLRTVTHLVVRDGVALVVDPAAGVAPLLQALHTRGARLVAVLDTHVHGSHVSGARELAARAGARVLQPAGGAVAWEHEPVGDGDTLAVGAATVRVVATPGHTPEHLALVLAGPDGDPVAVLAGGALVPDEPAWDETAPGLVPPPALGGLPDDLLVFPGHLTGVHYGHSPERTAVTTLGRARRAGAARGADGAAGAGSAGGVAGAPWAPYWPRLRAVNRAGPEPLGPLDPPRPLSAAAFAAALEEGAVALDARSPEAFAGAHVPGAVNVGAGPLFAPWAATALAALPGTAGPPGAAGASVPPVLVTETAAQAAEAARDLALVGHPRLGGWLAGGLRAWRVTGRPVAGLAVRTVAELAAAGLGRAGLGRADPGRADPGRADPGFTVLDVRQPAEWAQGRAPGALTVPAEQLGERLDDVPDDRDVLVVCGSGYRSSVAASLLQRRGHPRVASLLGGMSAWRAAGLPEERG